MTEKGERTSVGKKCKAKIRFSLVRISYDNPSLGFSRCYLLAISSKSAFTHVQSRGASLFLTHVHPISIRFYIPPANLAFFPRGMSTPVSTCPTGSHTDVSSYISRITWLEIVLFLLVSSNKNNQIGFISFLLSTRICNGRIPANMYAWSTTHP